MTQRYEHGKREDGVLSAEGLSCRSDRIAPRDKKRIAQPFAFADWVLDDAGGRKRTLSTLCGPILNTSSREKKVLARERRCDAGLVPSQVRPEKKTPQRFFNRQGVMNADISRDRFLRRCCLKSDFVFCIFEIPSLFVNRGSTP